jgi:hypothetical protein
VSLIMEGIDPAQAATTLEANGWTLVPAPDLWSISAALWSDLIGHQSPAATVPPAFRGATPANATLLSTGGDVLLRIWHAGARQDGSPVLVIALAPIEAAPSKAVSKARSAALQALAKDGAQVSPTPKAGQQ